MIFKEDVREIEGPVIVPDQELPGKPEGKPEKGKKFFFFKKKKTKVSVHLQTRKPFFKQNSHNVGYKIAGNFRFSSKMLINVSKYNDII